MAHALSELARLVDGQIEGDPGCVIHRVGSLQRSTEDAITFLADRKYLSDLQDIKAGAVILSPEHADAYHGNRLVVANPYAAFARIAQLLHPDMEYKPGVHPTAVVHNEAKIDSTAAIGAHSIVAAGATIGKGVFIGPLCQIGEDVMIGDHTRLEAHCTIYPSSQLGQRCRLEAGVIVGAAGFGYAEKAQKWLRIPQIGRVIIGNDVDIGAQTTIDRGTMDDTIIGNGVKLDNQIQIAHNVIVGEHTIMAAKVGIAGSAVIGKRCRLGGRCSIAGHLTLADDVVITATSMVSRSILQAGMYSSTLTVIENERWRKVLARIHRLQELAKRITALERNHKESQTGEIKRG